MGYEFLFYIFLTVVVVGGSRWAAEKRCSRCG